MNERVRDDFFSPTEKARLSEGFCPYLDVCSGAEVKTYVEPNGKVSSWLYCLSVDTNVRTDGDHVYVITEEMREELGWKEK
jgi:hypothetical protein